jgi:CBS domain-containing protein
VKVRDILDSHPVTAAPNESAGAAWERMHDRGIDYVVVLDDDRVVGMLSRHDLGGPAGGTRRRMGRRVGDLMRGDVVTVTPETSVQRAAMLIRRQGFGCLAVVVRHRLVGVVTVSHLLALLEKELAPE